MGKYEEALERAKAGMPMDDVFPELKESGDERRRKAAETVLGANGVDLINALVYLEKQKEQQPAEWSEEDAIRLEDVITLVEHHHDKEYNWFDYDDLATWLKSLRPHPHWKPYKEQISALERAIINMHTPSDIGILAELRDNLKKLQL